MQIEGSGGQCRPGGSGPAEEVGIARGSSLGRAGGLALSGALFVLALTGLAQAQERPPEPKASQEKAPSGKTEDPFYGLYVEIEPEFDTGLYGTKRRSDFLYVPVSLGYDLDNVLTSNDRASALVTVPWLDQRTQGNVVRVGGRLVRTSKAASHTPKTEAGLGDVLVDGGYTFFKQDKDRSLPSLSFDAEVKIPTADDERGLGTGSYDETLRLNLDVTFFKRWKVSLGTGYGFIGQPEDFSKPKFQDTIYWSGGLGYAFNPDNELWIRTDGDTAIVKHQPPYSLIYLEFDHWFYSVFNHESKLSFSFGAGTTTASPGLMVSLGYEYFF